MRAWLANHARGVPGLEVWSARADVGSDPQIHRAARDDMEGSNHPEEVL